MCVYKAYWDELLELNKIAIQYQYLYIRADTWIPT